MRSVAPINYAEACQLVLRFLRLSDGRKNVRVHSSKDQGTHWLITYAVPSIEDPSRIAQYSSIVVEKQTGYVYYFPSRSDQPIDPADMDSISRGCTRITPSEVGELERERRSRRK